MGKHKLKDQGEALVINEQFITIISKLLSFFKGDIKKTRAWLVTQNLNFGNIAPLRLIVIGKGKRVLEFIETSDAENQAT